MKERKVFREGNRKCNTKPPLMGDVKRPDGPPPPQKPVDLWKNGGLELYIKAVKASIERGKREQEKREEELRNECMDIRWKQLIE